MGPTPPLEMGPLWKTTDILQYKILPVHSPLFGIKAVQTNFINFYLAVMTNFPNSKKVIHYSGPSSWL